MFKKELEEESVGNNQESERIKYKRAINNKKSFNLQTVIFESTV